MAISSKQVLFRLACSSSFCVSVSAPSKSHIVSLPPSFLLSLPLSLLPPLRRRVCCCFFSPLLFSSSISLFIYLSLLSSPLSSLFFFYLSLSSLFFSYLSIYLSSLFFSSSISLFHFFTFYFSISPLSFPLLSIFPFSFFFFYLSLPLFLY